jgi:hypothetical protein
MRVRRRGDKSGEDFCKSLSGRPFHRAVPYSIVIPAKAGTQYAPALVHCRRCSRMAGVYWAPASAGVTTGGV